MRTRDAHVGGCPVSVRALSRGGGPEVCPSRRVTAAPAPEAARWHRRRGAPSRCGLVRTVERRLILEEIEHLGDVPPPDA